MKPPRPRITKDKLKWRYRPERGVWEPIFRIRWTENGVRREKNISLDWQGDAERLDKLYWECRSGRSEAQLRPHKHTWRACIEAWRSDHIVQQGLAASTKASYRRDMDRIMEKNGNKDMAATTRPALKAALAKMANQPRKASKYAQTVSILWNYAETELDWPLGPNPAKKLAAYKPVREFEPWPAWLVDSLPTAPDSVQMAAHLILGTGQRPNAAIRMKHSQFHGDTMTVLDEKGDELFDTHCPPRLRQFIEARPPSGEYLIAKNLRQPIGYSAVEKAFRAWRLTLGDNAKQFTLHGLRKLAIVELAEAGCSDAEIQAVTNQSSEMVAYYRKRANRVKLSKSAQDRRN
ncbi:tyrosine-type recombinase/integrase [Tritonibacter horizontis]|uniref:Phage integrase family protein n=1 Tax=Tritonibacter horizontis TaxID=1768241 RepID=A0A132BRV3_9RHOB|nr:tyrosine-type recombinase/integrase [Tritonibacter horizontis]KUP90936.1 phage integrase family protein [Tritonibacter horizontis]